MMPAKLDKLPPYIRAEFEKIQAITSPLVKKGFLFTIVSILMMSFSMANLYGLIFHVTADRKTLMILACALIGAIGMALYRETIYQNEEIRRTSIAYIKTRIKESKAIPAETKETYLEKITREPVNAFMTFTEFLSREERIKRIENN